MSKLQVFWCLIKRRSVIYFTSYFQLTGGLSEFTYIATQGPLHNTVNAFWRMVWEYEVSLIIMLTQVW